MPIRGYFDRRRRHRRRRSGLRARRIRFGDRARARKPLRLSFDRALGSEFHRELREPRGQAPGHREPRISGDPARRFQRPSAAVAARHDHHRASGSARPAANSNSSGCAGVGAEHREDRGRRRASHRVPILRPDYVAGAFVEPHSMEFDVHGLHQGFLKSGQGPGRAHRGERRGRGDRAQRASAGASRRRRASLRADHRQRRRRVGR